MAQKEPFKSLTDISEAFKTKKGLQARAMLSAFLNKDAEVREIGGNGYVVSGFVNVSGVVDEINDRLGTDFVEDPEYGNIPAQLSLFTHSKEEADYYASKLVRNSRIVSPVTIGTHEYNDQLYFDLAISGPFIEAPRQTDSRAPKRSGSAKDTEAPKGSAMEISDDDLPF